MDWGSQGGEKRDEGTRARRGCAKRPGVARAVGEVGNTKTQKRQNIEVAVSHKLRANGEERMANGDVDERGGRGGMESALNLTDFSANCRVSVRRLLVPGRRLTGRRKSWLIVFAHL